MGSIIGINKEKLNHDQYFASLVNEGVRSRLLPLDLAKNIPLELMEVFKEVMRMYTKGESSTLKAETAEDLMKSIVYSLDLYLMKYLNPEDAISHLQSCNIKTLYKEAMIYAEDYFESTKNLYQSVETKRVAVPNIVYNETFTKAIPNFFLDYDILFSAHNTSSDIDYPLVFDDMSVKGIAYIRSYLAAFELENDFCRKFDSKSITLLLQAYGKSNRLNYEQTPINLFELIFNNLVFLTLLDKGCENLLISPIGLEMIKAELSGISKTNLKHLISNILDKIINRLEITVPDLIDLIYRYSESMVERLNNALEYDHLVNMMVLETVAHHKEKTVLETGSKMNNRIFRFIYKKITDCSTVEDKMIILTKYVNSLEDFVDLLKADCFYEKEYDHLFNSLGNLEISTLITSSFKEYMLRGEEKLPTFLSNSIAHSYAWETAFFDWLRKLDKSRIQEIELLVHENLAWEII